MTFASLFLSIPSNAFALNIMLPLKKNLSQILKFIKPLIFPIYFLNS